MKNRVNEVLEELERRGYKSHTLSTEEFAETRDYINMEIGRVAREYSRKEAESEIEAVRSYFTD